MHGREMEGGGWKVKDGGWREEGAGWRWKVERGGRRVEGGGWKVGGGGKGWMREGWKSGRVVEGWKEMRRGGGWLEGRRGRMVERECEEIGWCGEGEIDWRRNGRKRRWEEMAKGREGSDWKVGRYILVWVEIILFFKHGFLMMMIMLSNSLPVPLSFAFVIGGNVNKSLGNIQVMGS